MTPPKILSIIIPSYNMEVYIAKCLESVVSQEASLLQRIDVMVVNDGSKDRTPEIAHDFSARYQGVVRIIDKTNGHYGSCVNRGIAEALGTFVKVLDADDTFDPKGFSTYLKKLAEICDKNIPVDLVWTNVRTMNSQYKETGITQFPLTPSDNLTLDHITQMPNDRCMHAATYRLSMLKSINYHQSEGIAYTDSEWMFAPMTAVKRVCYLPVVVYNYLLGREGQSMDAKVLRKQLSMLRETFRARAQYYAAHKSTWDTLTLRYAQSELSRAGTTVYRMHLQSCPWHDFSDLKKIDKIVSTLIPDLQSRIGETDVMFKGKSYAIPYGRTYANAPFLRIMIAYALKLKSKLH